MTAPIPPQLEGSQAPNTLEILWEKNRRTIVTIAVAIVFALGLNYAIQSFARAERNQEWSAFATTTGLAKAYSDLAATKGQFPLFMAEQALPGSLVKELANMDGAALEKAAASASAAQKPWILWARAVQAVLKGEADMAEKALAQLEREFPTHSLCVETSFPVQYRPAVERPADAPPLPAGKKPELEPVEKGSMVGRLREQIGNRGSFTPPAHFQPVPIPEDAPKVKVKTSAGEFTIALMVNQAPKHVAKFLELVEQKHWDGMRIDEVQRPGTNQNAFFAQKKARSFHFGLEASKGDDRSLWVSKEPSKHQIDYEHTDLSHFPGAVSALMEGEKSSLDRIWVSADDNVSMDGNRVVFGYVVEGMDVLKTITETGFATQGEEESGSGKPQDNITVESITKL